MVIQYLDIVKSKHGFTFNNPSQYLNRDSMFPSVKDMDLRGRVGNTGHHLLSGGEG